MMNDRPAFDDSGEDDCCEVHLAGMGRCCRGGLISVHNFQAHRSYRRNSMAMSTAASFGGDGAGDWLGAAGGSDCCGVTSGVESLNDHRVSLLKKK